ncbi:hypothetical protein C5O80_27065 [Burkholderia sp. SRS-46]|nr:hypothetical protein C5O80_27065 [Burkholderia sp. SRS-46]
MSLNMDVVIDTPDATVDMKSGLESLQGVSDAARCIAEAILTGNVPERQSHKSDVRTILKQSFSGSYGQIFSIDIFHEQVQKKFNKIGRPAFVELIAYFLNEAVYKEHKELSDKAQRVVDELGDKADDLVAQLRKSPLHHLHEVPMKFGYDVKVRYRKSRVDQTELARFDQKTAESLQAKLDPKVVPVVVAITRLNINTGNGRLAVKGEFDTVAFGFPMPYIRVLPGIKKVISENLNYNNGRDSLLWRHLHITAQPLKLPDGRVVKYIIKEIKEVPI